MHDAIFVCLLNHWAKYHFIGAFHNFGSFCIIYWIILYLLLDYSVSFIESFRITLLDHSGVFRWNILHSRDCTILLNDSGIRTIVPTIVPTSIVTTIVTPRTYNGRPERRYSNRLSGSLL